MTQGAYAFREIIATDEFGVLTGNEKQLAETLACKVLSFFHHFFDRERDAQDGVLTRESAVATAINAFIRQVKRGKEPHRATEMLKRELSRSRRERIQLLICLGRE